MSDMVPRALYDQANLELAEARDEIDELRYRPAWNLDMPIVTTWGAVSIAVYAFAAGSGAMALAMWLLGELK